MNRMAQAIEEYNASQQPNKEITKVVSLNARNRGGQK